MKCPNCGNEIGEGKLLCERCGAEIKIVPDYDIEVESQIHDVISSMADDLSDEDADETQETDEELKDSLRDYYTPQELGRNTKRLLIVAGVIVVMAVAGLLIRQTIRATQEDSFDYQYEQALACAAQQNYDDAVDYLERAIAIEPDNTQARFLLAQYYDENGQQPSAITVLKELLQLDLSNQEEIYDYLLSIYLERKEYEQMGEVLSACENDNILTKYNDYAALTPTFNKEGGVYDELISVTLKGNTDGFVYYTLDGTEPTTNSMVYETPILLESGDYTLKAYFVNMYGVASDIVTETYYISLSAPEEPIISLDSGSYSEPQLIEVYHDEDTKIFYTLDGTTPTSESERYTEPIEMPYGVSNFSIVAINEDGLASSVLKRTYQLSITANFSTELALQVLINNLWAQGELTDVDGHVPDKLGTNEYHVQTAVELDGATYYIVYEEYIDTVGKAHETNNIYAINADTADLYKAWKTGEGKYTLRAFE